MDCSVVIVNWNSAELLVSCIRSIKKSGNYQIIIVDNNSTDSSLKLLKKNGQRGIKVIANTENVGFGKACNQGAQIAKGENLLFLNPDIVLEQQAIAEMTKFLGKTPQAAAVGPKFLSRSGKKQTGYYLRFPSLVQVLLFYTKIKNYFLFNFLKNKFYEEPLPDTSHAIDQVPGAALMIRKEVFTRLHGFREDYFLWFEDVDLCWRVKKLNKQVYYLPSAIVRHVGGGSFKKWTDQSQKKIRFYNSLRLYFYYNHNYFSYIIVSLIPKSLFL